MTWDICPAATEVTQGFGCTGVGGEWPAPWCSSGLFHAGIDISSPGWSIYGAPVYASRPGTIVANQDPIHHILRCDGTVVDSPYLGPHCVVLATGDGYYIEYGHLSSAVVSPGDVVRAGDLIGYIGNEGSSCGPHLHLEVRTDGPVQNVWNNAAAIVDPTPFLMFSGAVPQPGGDVFVDQATLFAALNEYFQPIAPGQTTVGGEIATLVQVLQAVYNIASDLETKVNDLEAKVSDIQARVDAGGSNVSPDVSALLGILQRMEGAFKNA